MEQRKCKVCRGSGLVLRDNKYYFRCPGCGMYIILYLIYTHLSKQELMFVEWMSCWVQVGSCHGNHGEDSSLVN